MIPSLDIHYTRWRDRVAARLPWTSRHRQLRMARALIGGPEGEALQRRISENMRDLMLYGTSYCDPHGNRIEPEGWPPYWWYGYP